MGLSGAASGIIRASLTAFAVIAVLALLVPVAAPILDHHFADKLPYHGHILTGGVRSTHSHDFTAPHEHGSAATLNVNDGGPGLVPAPPAPASVKVGITLHRDVHDSSPSPDTGPERSGPSRSWQLSLFHQSPEPHPPRL